MKNRLFILSLGMVVFLSSCKEEKQNTNTNNTTPQQGITLQVKGTINGEDFANITEKLYGKSGGELFYISNWGMIVSHLSLVRDNGDTVHLGDGYQWIDIKNKRTKFVYPNVPTGSYKGISFMLGLDKTINHSDPSLWPATHPLNTNNTGLHWGWASGYIFQALDGFYVKDSATSALSGFSYHDATDAMVRSFFMPYNFTVDNTMKTATLNFRGEKFFESPNQIIMAQKSVSHSEGTDEINLMNKILENAPAAYTIESVK